MVKGAGRNEVVVEGAERKELVELVEQGGRR